MIWWGVAVFVVLILFAYAGAPVIWTRALKRSCVRKTGMRGRVALTFDDGPHPEYTPQLLDIFLEHDVRATFFVLAAQALRHKDIIRRMIKEGHDIEIHGDRHWFVPFLLPHLTWRQCLGARRVVEAEFGITSSVYRPTWGACNILSLRMMRRGKMYLCTWSIMVGDWRITEPTELVSRIASKLTDEDIIVLHDSDVTFGAETGAPNQVIAAMPEIIQMVKSKGYEFVTVAECLRGRKHAESGSTLLI